MVQNNIVRAKPSAPDDHISVIDTPFGKIGLAICYDLRFPTYLGRASCGCWIITLPSAFTKLPVKPIGKYCYPGQSD